MLFLHKIKEIYESNALGISVTPYNGWKFDNVLSETILFNKKEVGSFQLANIPQYCGGIVMCSMTCSGMYYSSVDPKRKEKEDNFIAFVKQIFEHCKQKNPFVIYVATYEQTYVMSILEKLGFTKAMTFVNPNTNKTCYQWTIDLTKISYEDSPEKVTDAVLAA